MSTQQTVVVDKHKFQISNLDKVLYPEMNVVKAEVIQFYLNIAPTMLRHIKRCPLTLIRYPDGIHGKKFFQKDKPRFTPDWIESVELGRGKSKSYILPKSSATMVWLANLASLELHYMQYRAPNFTNPFCMIFDLDPPEGKDFRDITDLAFKLKDHLENYDYHVFIKTSGSKGLHLFVPIQRKYDDDTVVESARKIAQSFIKMNPGLATLAMKKESRGDRILIDIYRNHHSQTVIAPYSLRANEDAAVSMPIRWPELADIESSRSYHIRNVAEYLENEGDAWEGFSSFEVELHDHRTTSSTPVAPEPSEYFKTPEQLKEYAAKRDFDKTPEPSGANGGPAGNRFVVHRHHATRLHYDLRLEENGVLRSWAVPRGLPQRPGIKRLAVETEPHPIEYLYFDGEIPKGEYGGGKMWIFFEGTYQITKEKKSGFYFHLSSPLMDGEFRIYHTKDKEWLLERTDAEQFDIADHIPKHMLAEQLKKVPIGDQYTYEIKWDGIRVLLIVDEGNIRIISRNHKELTEQFPEITDNRSIFNVSAAIFDAEIVCLDSQGRPNFKKVIGRMHQTHSSKIERSSKSNPAVAYVFDCLYLDGRYLYNDPLWRRREWLQDSIKKNPVIRVSETLEDGEALFKAVRDHGMEGIIAKDLTSKYYPGKRSRDWIKVKVRQTMDCQIVGYTKGQGDREKFFGAMHIVELTDEGPVYRGKVGTGYDSRTMKELRKIMEEHASEEKLYPDILPDEPETQWLKPGLVCEIQYASITQNETLREPVFIKLREG